MNIKNYWFYHPTKNNYPVYIDTEEIVLIIPQKDKLIVGLRNKAYNISIDCTMEDFKNPDNWGSTLDNWETFNSFREQRKAKKEQENHEK